MSSDNEHFYRPIDPAPKAKESTPKPTTAEGVSNIRVRGKEHIIVLPRAHFGQEVTEIPTPGNWYAVFNHDGLPIANTLAQSPEGAMELLGSPCGKSAWQMKRVYVTEVVEADDTDVTLRIEEAPTLTPVAGEAVTVDSHSHPQQTPTKPVAPVSLLDAAIAVEKIIESCPASYVPLNSQDTIRTFFEQQGVKVRLSDEGEYVDCYAPFAPQPVEQETPAAVQEAEQSLNYLSAVVRSYVGHSESVEMHIARLARYVGTQPRDRQASAPDPVPGTVTVFDAVYAVEHLAAIVPGSTVDSEDTRNALDVLRRFLSQQSTPLFANTATDEPRCNEEAVPPPRGQVAYIDPMVEKARAWHPMSEYTAPQKWKLAVRRDRDRGNSGPSPRFGEFGS